MSPLPPDASRAEHRALRVSMLAALALGVIGTAWGLSAGSQIVLFDGVYAFVGVLLAYLSLHASRVVDRGPTTAYPYGRDGLVPLVVGAQGLVLLGTCLYASIDAVLVILGGGSEVEALSVLLYGALTLLVAIVLALLLRRIAPRSELVGAEAIQWQAGALLSLAMVVGFSAALLLADTDWDRATDFIDPGLVLFACVVLLPTPVRMLRVTGRELLEAAPPLAVRQPVHDAIEQVRAEFGLDEPLVRLSKLGRKLYVEVDFVVPEGAWDVSDEDRVRRAVGERLADLPYDVWLNVDLSTDPEWGRG